MSPFTFDAWNTVITEMQRRRVALVQLLDALDAITSTAPNEDIRETRARIAEIDVAIDALRNVWQAPDKPKG